MDIVTLVHSVQFLHSLHFILPSPFIPILGIIRLTGASPFSLNLRLTTNFEYGK